MSAADLDGRKKLIEEARTVFGHCGDDCMFKECRMGQRVFRALDSAVAHIGRLEGQQDEASAMHAPMRVQTGSKTHGGGPEYGFICAICRESHPCRTRRVLSRTEDEPTTNCAPSPDCGCSCHRMLGVSHIAACCDQPPYGWLSRTEDGTDG